jgi:hypothetical protein
MAIPLYRSGRQGKERGLTVKMTRLFSGAVSRRYAMGLLDPAHGA